MPRLLALVALSAVGAGVARAELGDVGFILEPSYSWCGTETPWPHAAGLGAALELGVTRIAALRLATGYQYAPPMGELAVGADAAQGVAVSGGAVLLVDTLPGLHPVLGVEAALRYRVGSAAAVAAAPAAPGAGLQAGAVIGLGLEVEVADPIWIGAALRYWMLAPVDALAEPAPAGELAAALTLGLRLRPLASP